jgi:hypothetical protein
MGNLTLKTLIKEEFYNLMEMDNSMHLSQDDLNQILRGYLVAALWTEEDNLKSQMGSDEDEFDDEDEDESELDKLVRVASEFNRKDFSGFVIENIDNDSKIQAYMDIKSFLNMAGTEAVREAVQENGFERLGHDIWLTRNHHGAGFFDHSYEYEKVLMDAAHRLKSVDLYITDDYKLVFSNA